MTSQQDKPHPSRIDWWIALLLAVGPVVLINLGIYLQKSTPGGEGAGACMLTGIVLGILTWLLTFPCQYTFEDDRLVVQAGLRHWRIPYTNIDSIEPSTNLQKSPALSLHRIQIQHDRKTIYISPLDRDRFIRKLQEKVGQSNA